MWAARPQVAENRNDTKGIQARTGENQAGGVVARGCRGRPQHPRKSDQDGQKEDVCVGLS